MNNNSGAKSSRGKTMLIGIVIAILIAIGLFAAGYIKGRAEVTNLNSQISTLKAQTVQAQSQLVVAQSHYYLMQADAELYHTAIDLEQRNFGTANDRLKKVVDALGKVTQNSGNVDMTAIAKLRTDISALDLNVAVNVEIQRTQVLQFATQLDELIGK